MLPLLIGAGVAGAGLLAKAFGAGMDQPEYKAPQRSAYDDARLEQYEQQANQSEGDIAKDTMSGTEAGGALIADQGGPGGLGSSGDMTGLTQAIHARAKQAYDRDYGTLGKQASLDAYTTRNRRQAQAHGLRDQWTNIDQAVANQTNAASIQQDIARNNIISGLMGGAGAIGGIGAAKYFKETPKEEKK